MCAQLQTVGLINKEMNKSKEFVLADRSSCHAIAAALISLVSIVCYFNQYRVPSAFTNQGLLQYLAMIFVSYGGGSVHRRAVFFQWVKYRYEPTSDPCALAFNSFSSDRIAQKERKG